MGLGTGIPNSKPALFLIHQEIAEWGLCVCMPRLYKTPCSLYDRGVNMPESQGKGQDRLWEGKARAFILWSPE